MTGVNTQTRYVGPAEMLDQAGRFRAMAERVADEPYEKQLLADWDWRRDKFGQQLGELQRSGLFKGMPETVFGPMQQAKSPAEFVDSLRQFLDWSKESAKTAEQKHIVHHFNNLAGEMLEIGSKMLSSGMFHEQMPDLYSRGWEQSLPGYSGGNACGRGMYPAMPAVVGYPGGCGQPRYSGNACGGGGAYPSTSTSSRLNPWGGGMNGQPAPGCGSARNGLSFIADLFKLRNELLKAIESELGQLTSLRNSRRCCKNSGIGNMSIHIRFS